VTTTLQWPERLYYRDRLREARYAALADAESFSEICFAVEAIGLRLCGTEASMQRYADRIRLLAADSDVITTLPEQFPQLFSRFDSLYKTVQIARNDAMHTGVYARHVTTAAIELCIALEEALMKEQQMVRTKVEDYMVRSPVIVQRWQPVAYARQLMLMHSFTFLPIQIGDWFLLPESSMARFLHGNNDRKNALATSIVDAANLENGPLVLVGAQIVQPEDDVSDLLNQAEASRPTLWLVSDNHGGIAGVLSPFELM
jgi:hypothetical protein